MMIDLINEKGGVLGKYKIVQVDGDSQSKTEAAINEAERLLNVEKVDILAGVYSSAHAVPLAEKVDKQKKFLWITTAISDAVLKDRNLEYTFRPQTNGGLFGVASVQYIAGNAQDKFKKAAKDLRIAIIYEDGPYGVGVAGANEGEAKRQGMQIVLKEGYSASAPDLSSLVTKLRAAAAGRALPHRLQPGHQSPPPAGKEQGLRVRAYIGHGAGHSQLDKLKEAFGNEVEGFHSVDPPAAQLIDAKKLKPGVGDLTQEMVKRYKAFEPNIPIGGIAPHVSMGFNNMWILLNDVLPRAIQKHGGFTPRRPRQGRARDRHPRGRHHAGLRSEVPRRGEPDARAERAGHRRPCTRSSRASSSTSGPGDRMNNAGDPAAPRRLPRARSPAGAPRPASCLRAGGGACRPPGARRPRAPCSPSPAPTKRFGGFTALNNVSFEVAEGEILGLIGPNGSGKTTMFNCVSGALPPTAGPSASRARRSPASRRTRSATAGVARTFQIPRPFRKLSILENVAVAAHFGADDAQHRGRGPRARAREVLGLVGLPADPEASTALLGAGGLKKLELARALATRPEAPPRRREPRRARPVARWRAPRKC